MKRLLVTGPVERMAEWTQAVHEAGWEPIPFPLVAVHHKDVTPREVLGNEPAIDWICATSANALPFLARARDEFEVLTHITSAAVGERTTSELARLGFPIAFEASTNVEELAARVRDRARRDERVLWPHGDRSDDLASLLRAHGLTVVDPIVYETRTREDLSPPGSDGVFFASPSGVEAWHEDPSNRPCLPVAIAIGATTMRALQSQTEGCFERYVVLPSATPRALTHMLRTLASA